MDWTEVNAQNDETWDGKGSVEGKYIGKKTEVGPNKSNIYTLTTDKGNVGVWGSTVLDNKFTYIPVGSQVKIEFAGMQDGKRGQYKDYKVFFKEAPFVEVKKDEVPIANYENEINLEDIPF